MTERKSLLTYHGVMMNVADQGVLITGKPGIGKSSLALALLQQGHQLIADDVIEITRQLNQLITHCPANLSGLLHTRELGLLDISRLYGEEAVRTTQQLDFIVELSDVPSQEHSIGPAVSSTPILGITIPTLHLSIHTPCSLEERLRIWFASHPYQAETEKELKQRQQQMMQQ